MLVVGVTIFLLVYRSVTNSRDIHETGAYLLPDSPLSASYNIGEREVQLVQGKAEGADSGLEKKEMFEVVGEPYVGDINDDGEDDAFLLLNYTNLSEEQMYYLALALKDRGGYLGGNALPLKEERVPQKVSVHDGYIKLTYGGTLENGSEETTVTYFALLGTSLRPVEFSEAGEQIYQGTYIFNEDTQTFTPCDESTTYSISQTSSSYAALEAIYIERTKMSENAYTPIYIVLTGIREGVSEEDSDEENQETFTVTGIVSVPRQGVCGEK